MNAPSSCLRCGRSVPVDAPAGQCPGCLLAVGRNQDPLLPGTSNLPGLLAVGQLVGDFVLERQIGTGAMGMVYEARHHRLKWRVALKFLRDSAVASPRQLFEFENEAKSIARLDHPNIVGFHGMSEINGQPYICMELVEGESLREGISRGDFRIASAADADADTRGRQVRIARLIARLARALDHAHRRRVFHRDIKPANILVDRTGQPQLTDFGLALIGRDPTGSSRRKSSSSNDDIAGTPAYMSPEQAFGKKVTEASDVYGLGAVLYELLTGVPPFRGTTVYETMQWVKELPPKPPRKVNPLIARDLEVICMKALEKDPRRRFISAAAMADDLEAWMDHKPIQARPVGSAIRGLNWMRRNRMGTALIAVLLLAFIGTLTLLAIVEDQKRRYEMQQALLFGEKSKQLSLEWQDPEKRSLRILSTDLAILDSRIPTDAPDALRVSFGMIVKDDPINNAQNLAMLFSDVQMSLQRALNRNVQLDFVAIKGGTNRDNPLRENDLDFMLLEPADYLLLRASDPGMTAFAQIADIAQGIWIARSNSSIASLAQLRDRILGLPEVPQSMVIRAKSRLVDAGLMRGDFRSVTQFAPVPGPEPMAFPMPRNRDSAAAVVTGGVDAAPVSRNRYELARHQGLVLLDEFPIDRRVFVARPGLATNILATLRTALCRNHQRQQVLRPELDQDGSFPSRASIIPIDDRDLVGLREAMRKAAHFDGKPDPFPASP